jgi:GTPase Era involved in 16S rRNA processing
LASALLQVLLYDTPGLVDQPGQGNPVERLHSAWATAASADWLLLIVDAERQVGSCRALQDTSLSCVYGGQTVVGQQTHASM